MHLLKSQLFLGFLRFLPWLCIFTGYYRQFIFLNVRRQITLVIVNQALLIFYFEKNSHPSITWRDCVILYPEIYTLSTYATNWWWVWWLVSPYTAKVYDIAIIICRFLHFLGEIFRRILTHSSLQTLYIC